MNRRSLASPVERIVTGAHRSAHHDDARKATPVGKLLPLAHEHRQRLQPAIDQPVLSGRRGQRPMCRRTRIAVERLTQARALAWGSRRDIVTAALSFDVASPRYRPFTGGTSA